MEVIAVKASLDTLKMLSPVLADELSRQWNLLYKVHDSQQKCEIMMAFLKDADKDENQSHLVKTLVEQVRDTTYDVEEIIDKFIYQFHDRKRGECCGLLHSIILLPEECIIRWKIATKVQRCKDRVDSILMKGNQLIGLIKGESVLSDSYRIDREMKYPPILDDKEIVGIKEKVNSLVRLLVGGNTGRMVISVVGMGGLGKTTLVLEAYHSTTVQKSFDCHVHLSFWQSSNIKEALTSLAKELKVDVEDTMSPETLMRRVYEFLTSKSYVVVLDDVWSTEVWNNLQHAFPSRTQHQSRIMLTTQDKKVASSLGSGSRNFPLEPLNSDDAWDLFEKKAFHEGSCPSNLEHLARKFVERCEGLPFAIVSIGGLLACTEHHMWETIYNSLDWELANNDMLKTLNRIILLSFYDLPPHLKDCFLYFSVFPKNRIIHRKKLIRLWMAEGFVEQKDGSTLEEVAEGYLRELINRSMIQLVETNEFGRVKTCRIHDITHGIAITKSKEKRFSMVYRGEQETSSNAKIRRLSICEKGESFQSNEGMKHLRSFHVFDGNMPSSSLHAMFSRFKMLRVLDLQGANIESVPDLLTDCFLLRYLNLRSTKVKKLPKSLDKLIYLQSLDVGDTQIDKLPNGIVKLQNLRHLYFYCKKACSDEHYRDFHPIHVPKEICDLKDLRSLSMVEANEEIIGKLANLSKLRRFGVHKLREVDGEELCKSLAEMKDLQNLSISSTSKNEVIQLDSLSCPPVHLKRLALQGRLNNLPRWFWSDSLKNLTYLQLHYSQLEEDQLSSLQNLDQVVFLLLLRAYNGTQLIFRDGSFPRLRKLYLHTLPQLSHMRIEPGSMTSIKELNLLYCIELKEVPEGIEKLRLQKLYLVSMPEELIGRMRTNGGQDRERIQHIPYIKHAYRRGRERCFENLSGWIGSQMSVTGK